MSRGDLRFVGIKKVIIKKYVKSRKFIEGFFPRLRQCYFFVLMSFYFIFANNEEL